MRRSRRKGQLRRISSCSFTSTVPSRISSLSCEAWAMMRPKGSARNEPPQKSSPAPCDLVAANVAGLVADAIDRADVDSVGDGVRALDGEPGVVLRRAPLFFLRRMPADGGGIEEHVRTLQGGQPRALRIPLVPADQRSHRALLPDQSSGSPGRRA